MGAVIPVTSTAADLADSVSKAAPVPPPAAPDRDLAQAVSKAVSQLNESGFAGQGREVTISLDPGTHQPVVRVVDINSGEVLRQWPSQYVLQIAEDSKSQESR